MAFYVRIRPDINHGAELDDLYFGPLNRLDKKVYITIIGCKFAGKE